MKTVIISERECLFDDDADTSSLYVRVNTDGYVSLIICEGHLRGHRYCRVLVDAPKGTQVDHKNGNPLDNRRCNLRLASSQQQMFNRAVSKDKKSKLPKGVTRKGNKFIARITYNYTTYELGSFYTVREAEAAYKNKAIEWQGDFASHLEGNNNGE